MNAPTRDRRRIAGRMRRIQILSIALVAILTTGCAAGGGTPSPGFEIVSPGGKLDFSYPINERKAIPELSGPAVIGDKRISTADYRGYVVVLNVWGSWCAPCRAEAPYLITAARDLHDRGVRFIGINVRETREEAAAFEQARQIPYPSIFDSQMRTLLAIRGFPVSSIPSTIVLDRQGRVARIWLRAFTGPAELVAEVAEVAAEEAPPPGSTDERTLPPGSTNELIPPPGSTDERTLPPLSQSEGGG